MLNADKPPYYEGKCYLIIIILCLIIINIHFNQFDLISFTGGHVYVDSQTMHLYVVNYHEIE